MPIFTIAFTQIDCCYKGCGVSFAITSEFEDRRRKDHVEFYCPNGHPQGFHGKTAEEERIDALQAEKLRLESSLDYARGRLDRVQKHASAQMGRATRFKNERDRIKTRIANGVCPCCNRSFQKVRLHMTIKHPDFKLPASDE